MIQRLRALPAAVGLSFILGCGSPTAPDIPAPDPPDDSDDPKTGVIAFEESSPASLLVSGMA